MKWRKRLNGGKEMGEGKVKGSKRKTMKISGKVEMEKVEEEGNRETM